MTMRARARDLGIVFFFVAIFVVLSVSTNTFLRQDNLLNILDQSSELLVLTAAITVCIVAGIFDLSIASTATVAAIATAGGVNVAGWPGGIVAGLGAGAALGLFNGLAIGFSKVNSFIGTLATSFAFKGFAIVISGGSVVAINDPGDRETLANLFTGRFLRSALYRQAFFRQRFKHLAAFFLHPGKSAKTRQPDLLRRILDRAAQGRLRFVAITRCLLFLDHG